MQHFPVFLNLRQQPVVVVGGGDSALAKLRLLLKTEALITVFAPHPHRQIAEWAEGGALSLHRRSPTRNDLANARLIYAAEEHAAKDAHTAHLAQGGTALVNIVDNLQDSQFITPAIVDRDPVTVAIGTEGTAPVLARQIKSAIEARLPPSLGPLARAAAGFRTAAEALPKGRARRDFWQDVFVRLGPRHLAQNGTSDANLLLHSLLADHLAARPSSGHITFTAAPSDDPEMLTLKARNALDSADVIVHDASIAPALLDLARREAILVRLDTPDTAPHLVRLLHTHVAKGAAVLRLSIKTPDHHTIRACQALGLTCQQIAHVPATIFPLSHKETA